VHGSQLTAQPFDGSGDVAAGNLLSGSFGYVTTPAVAALLMVACGTAGPTQGEGGTSTGQTAPASAAQRTQTSAATSDVARSVDLGNGRSIHLECRGSGGPTVVLVAGLG